MSFVPWSAKGDQPILNDDDSVMLFVPSNTSPNKNKRITGSILKTILRPTPPNTHYIKNQAQLETALGTNLIIPTNTAVTVVIDESFVLTKPFKKQSGSSLLLYSESSNIKIDYSGTGALIQMDNAGDIGDRTQLINLKLIGSFGNNCFAIEDAGFFTIDKCTIQQFAAVGFIKGSSVLWNQSGFFAVLGGLNFINCRFVTFSDSSSDDFGFSPGITLINFITDSLMDVVFRNALYETAAADFFIFIDPNMLANGSVTVRDSGIDGEVPESLFQKGKSIDVLNVQDQGGDASFGTSELHNLSLGDKVKHADFTIPEYNGEFVATEILNSNLYKAGLAFLGNDAGSLLNRPVNVTAVVDNGSGKTRFIVPLLHGLSVGKVIVLRNFATYNQTAIVTAVDTPITGTTFDADIPFVATETGLADASSLDGTDNRVDAVSNPDQPDSMALAEVRSNVPISFTSVSGVFTPIENSPSVQGDFIEDPATESFSIDTGTGAITYTGLEPITATIAFDFLISKDGGGTDNAIISLFDFATQLTKTNQPILLTSTVQKVDYNGGIFKIKPGDVLELLINNDAVSTINVSALKILITRQ